MSDKPTYPIADPAALTLAQRDGRACVTCRIEIAPMRPVGIVDGVQVFACVSCDGEPVTGTIPGQWPDGEPESVRAIERARRLIERHAALAAELRAAGAERAAQTMDAGCAAFERVIAALESGDGEAIDDALGDALVTMTRGQATLARYVVAVAAVE